VSETRKLAAILAADIVGYSRLAGGDEDRILARLRTLRSDLIDPTISVHHGRVVKRAGDGSIIEFRSVVDAVRCAIEVQNGMVERNAGLPPERRIEFRVGIHLGDVVEESDGDLMGDGVNIAARLEGVAEPGGVCLSSAAYEQVRDKLGQKFADLGERNLKNIARPVRIYALSPGMGDTGRLEAEKSGPPRLSIVVLPFANIGGDPEQEYFVDGVTGSLTTDLSRIRDSFVIARNTAFTYKGKAVDAKKVGHDLNVRYVLEGSVQRGGNRMRVNVELIDAETGSHLWAERFENSVADLFDLQEEIVARLANTLSMQLMTAEARRAEKAPTPDSMDLYFQGMSRFNKGVTPEFMAQARTLFERALALDPNNMGALIGTALVDVAVGAGFASDDMAARFAMAEAAAIKVLSLLPENAIAHLCLGMALAYTDRAVQAIEECERAVDLDRNFAHAHAQIGLFKTFIGRAEECDGHTRTALQLSPRDPWVFAWQMNVGYAKACLGRDEDAVIWLRRSIESNRNYPSTHLWLAGALANLGRLDEARAAAQAGLALDPKFTIARLRATKISDSTEYLARRRLIVEGMRKSGVPDGSPSETRNGDG
jgi:TolB-like protein/class 3 adenylate cyclase